MVKHSGRAGARADRIHVTTKHSPLLDEEVGTKHSTRAPVKIPGSCSSPKIGSSAA